MRRFTTGLWPLVRANVKSFYRDRASLFWTFAFPLIFVVLFGSLYSGGPNTTDIGWVDEDNTASSQQLRDAFEEVPILVLSDATRDVALADMRTGSLDAVLVVPAGLGDAVAPGEAGAPPPAQPFALVLYTDPSNQTTS